MAFFQKLKQRLFKSSSRIDEGLDALIEAAPAPDAPLPETLLPEPLLPETPEPETPKPVAEAAP
ncbi:signal recognition particle-docking protein FtsY, partial [Amaricoccus sp. HAR-UPW-R2A-40]